MLTVNSSHRAPLSGLLLRKVLAVSFLLGITLFVVELGSIGLVDETPPLFASSARAMAETGDWLIPHVNGLPRYDKPPLVYWLMAGLYRLPAPQHWDPLGSWSAALPSALASVAVVMLLALLMAWWDRRFWLVAPLIWGLSPLVMAWSRIGVSDALLTALVTAALLASWLRLVCAAWPWWPCWVMLALAVLTKGPVAIALFGLTWIGFALRHRGKVAHAWFGMAQRLKLLPGLLLCLAITLPWYGAAAWRDGAPFLQSFFGYHNLQRFTEVVNHHHSPWWFYGALLLLASLPWSAALVLGLWRALRADPQNVTSDSLPQFCACWLLAVLLLFSVSATKLPSYWLPATPAAALLVVTVAQQQDWLSRLTLRLGAITSLVIALLLALSSSWLPLINDQELAGLPAALDHLHLVPMAVMVLLIGGASALALLRQSNPWSMLAVQSSWLLLLPLLWWPLLRVGDALRSAPLRAMAAEVVQRQSSVQPLVMAGLIKPSVHFYARVPVAYEGTSDQALVNLHDRLLRERRVRVPAGTQRLLVLAPLNLKERRGWGAMLSPLQAQHGPYGLWWLDLQLLDRRAAMLQLRKGLRPTWQEPRPERF